LSRRTRRRWSSPHELSFDTSDPDSINDAFEASVLDANGHTLVHTFASGRDAFFNVTEDVGLALGPGVTQTGDVIKTVTLDMASVLPGTNATVRFRLVNNDEDTKTSVRILEVLVPGDDPPTLTVGLANDTAPTGPGSEPFLTDRLTNDATLIGTVADDRGVTRLEVRVDEGPFQDITAALVGEQFHHDPGTLTPGRTASPSGPPTRQGSPPKPLRLPRQRAANGRRGRRADH
jgi:hypothetical protein